MNCAMSTIKYIIFIFNFFFALSGILIVVFGILANTKTSNFREALAGNLSLTSALLIGVGVGVFLIAFLGCCGAIQESHCMMITYAICLLTIFFIEIGVGTMAFVYRSKTQDYLSKSMSKIFDKYENNADARNIVNALQHELHCCGTNSPASWAGKYPSSCCQIDAGKHYTGSCPGETWAVGCVEAMSNLIRDQLETMGSIAMSVAAIEIIGIVASLCLASAIRRSERNYA